MENLTPDIYIFLFFTKVLFDKRLYSKGQQEKRSGPLISSFTNPIYPRMLIYSYLFSPLLTPV